MSGTHARTLPHARTRALHFCTRSRARTRTHALHFCTLPHARTRALHFCTRSRARTRTHAHAETYFLTLPHALPLHALPLHFGTA